MSTEKEKLAAIKRSVDIAKNKLESLDIKKENGTMTRAEMFERDMTINCIKQGERILIDYINGSIRDELGSLFEDLK